MNNAFRYLRATSSKYYSSQHLGCKLNRLHGLHDQSATQFYQQDRGGKKYTTSQTTSLSNNSTIYALSTPPGRSAIAVIRVSGPQSIDIYRSLCPAKPLPMPREATLRTLYQPTTPALVGSKREILDPGALILYFPGPKSFTGEDILELHVHGGPAVLKAVLSAIPKCQPTNKVARMILPAEPGEFTRRAFYNSRLSLPQIEALGETLAAETEQQRLLSVRGGHSAAALTARYEGWRTQLISARGELEALIDFSEDQQFEESPAVLIANVCREVIILRDVMKLYVQNACRGELMRNGINLALFGSPNAGKSSLLNRIVGREAVIVSERPGTTRDVVDLAVDLDGWMVIIGDTAGLRTKDSLVGSQTVIESSKHAIDEIEFEGIRRARERVLSSDVIILLLAFELQEGTFVLHIDEYVVELAKSALDQGKQILVALNKVDLLPPNSKLNDFVQQVQYLLPGIERLRILGISCTSAEQAHAESVQKLLHSLTNVFKEMTAPFTIDGMEIGNEGIWAEAIGATTRQKVLIEECVKCLDGFLEGTNESDADHIDIVLKAEELREAANCMARITGRGEEVGDVDEVLGVVFER